VFNAQTYRDWVGLDGDDVVLGVAPLFHITGLIAHIAVCLLIGAPMVLMYRLDPSLTLDTAEAEGATFTIGSITVFIGMLNAPNAEKSKLATLSKIFSGGAPVPPSTVTAFSGTFGHYIHNAYGLTETSYHHTRCPCAPRPRWVQRPGAVGGCADLQHRCADRGGGWQGPSRR